MDVIKTISEVKSRLDEYRSKPGKTVALVPTMGFFHEGHLSLTRTARQDCDLVVVSIFVNPAQFAPTEDLEEYPRDLASDLEFAARENVDLVFTPDPSEMYPEDFDTYIDPGHINDALCGQGRPGHFRGVATVVAKLFNIINPDRAYFGQKDAQQAALIRRMVKDLDYGIEIRVCPIVRESDGLAMSSRNAYLTAEERAQAPVIHQALLTAREAVAHGERDAAKIRRLMRRTMGQNYLVEFEYARIVDPETMEPIAVLDREVLAAVAATVGKARLIDNLMIAP